MMDGDWRSLPEHRNERRGQLEDLLLRRLEDQRYPMTKGVTIP